MDPSYREQPACVSCKHAFEEAEYDAGYSYYCTLNAPARPRCGSVLLDEDFGGGIEWDDPQRDAKYEERMDAWTAWSDGRRVVEHGICDRYVKADDAALGGAGTDG